MPAPGVTGSAGGGASRAAADCAVPECLAYHGGAVQHSPRVILLLWGPRWSSNTTAKKAYNYLYWFYKSLGTAADTWSTITSQYGDATGAPAFGGPVLATVYQDASTPPDPVTQADIAAESAKVPSAAVTNQADTQIVIASQPGTCFGDAFDGDPKGCATATPDSYCGWHSVAGGVPYVNLPFQLDAGKACGQNAVNPGSDGEFDGFGITAGAQYADTITDPVPPGGWVATAATVSEGEIAGACAPGENPLGATEPKGDLHFGVPVGKTTVSFPFAVQGLWSNALGRCILTTSPKLTVPVPRTQSATIGRAVSFQLPVSSNTGTALAYAANGLPPGLSIGAATGKVTGKPVPVTPGTWQVTVTVSDPLQYAAARTVRFRWQVSSPTGAMRGTWSKCVDDSGGNTKNGAKVDIYSCNGTGPQRITFGGDGELHVDFRCVTGGRLAYLEPCTGATDQVWTRLLGSAADVAR